MQEFTINMQNSKLQAIAQRLLPEDFSHEISFLLENKLVRLQMSIEQLEHFKCELFNITPEQLNALKVLIK
jgi:hypothetical protein